MQQPGTLLVEWESPWRAFVSSARVMLARGVGRRRGAQIRTGISLRAPAASIACHFVILTAWIVLAPWQDNGFLYRTPKIEIETNSPGPVIYYVHRELPAISGLEGAQEGRSGTAGGSHLRYQGPTIRIVRGTTPVRALADTPTLRLPVTNAPVANLLVLTGAAPSPEAMLRNLSHAGSQLPVRAEAVPPAPTASSLGRAVTRDLITASVVPPAPEVKPELRRVAGIDTSPVVVPPPPDVESLNARPRLKLPVTGVAVGVAARPDASDGSANSKQGGGGTESAAVGSTPGGMGQGGSGVAIADIVITDHPGTTPGIPADASKNGIIVISSMGNGRPGLGGSGGGSGTGNGPGTGSGTSGNGPGAGAAGTGYGSDPNAVGGIAGGHGPGGAGGGVGRNTVPGVAISGGVVMLPSFGANSAPAAPRRSTALNPKPPAIVVMGTSRSGGALPLYGFLHGSRVYTVYLEIPHASVVLQFSDPASTVGDQDLTPPEPIQTTFPLEERARTILSGVLDRTGVLRKLRIVEAGSPDLAVQIVKHLGAWRFRPALRGGEAVDVEAVIGFGVDTK